MNNHSSIKSIDITNLSYQTKFRLNKIIKEDYFHSEVQQRKIIGKKLRKYVATFDYFDKVLIGLSSTAAGISIIFFASVIGVPTEIASASVTRVLSLKTGTMKKVLEITRNKVLEITRNKKKKHDKNFMLSKSKLNNIENIISQASIDLETSHEELKKNC